MNEGGDESMMLLEDIPTFPRKEREMLETLYGIATAEAFYEHAVHNRQGLCQAMETTPTETDRLVKLVEGQLPPARIASIRRPLVKKPRGVVVDRDQPKASKP